MAQHYVLYPTHTSMCERRQSRWKIIIKAQYNDISNGKPEIYKMLNTWQQGEECTCIRTLDPNSNTILEKLNSRMQMYISVSTLERKKRIESKWCWRIQEFNTLEITAFLGYNFILIVS